jgi:putative membrane protein
MKPKELLVFYVKGLLMGIADIIPGVSGGTIALITGIYERFIFAIKSIRPTSDLRKIDWGLLLPLGLGIATSFLAMSMVMGFLLEAHTALVYAFFFGLILASAGFICKHIDAFHPKHLLAGSLGFLLSFLLVGLGVLEASHSLLFIFVSGALAICAMMLPGISGAFILLTLGQYEYMLDALKTFRMAEIGIFLGGILVGLVTFSRVISYLLKNHEHPTLAFLTGLMLGGLRLPYERMAGGDSIPLMLLFLALGAALVIVLERKTRQLA